MYVCVSVCVVYCVCVCLGNRCFSSAPIYTPVVLFMGVQRASCCCLHCHTVTATVSQCVLLLIGVIKRTVHQAIQVLKLYNSFGVILCNYLVVVVRLLNSPLSGSLTTTT